MHFFNKQQITYFILITIFIIIRLNYRTDTTIQSPTVNENSVSDNDTTPIFAAIDGAIKNPDIYSITPDTRIADLIKAAGGITQANTSCINQAQKVFDTQKIYIPFEGEACEPEILVNINTATAEQLQTLPSIGPTRAEDIINYRTLNGPFDSIEKLQEVSGIGSKTFDKIRMLITI